MSDLGYQSNAQAGLTPCYNNLDSYTDSLRKAVATPYPPYVEIGTHKDGEWVQLNTNILQIENEYYSNIRPKRVTYTGERPIQALVARGVQYVEVRLLESWLVGQVAPAYDALKADPSRALSIDEVRARLAAEHQNATTES